MNFGSFLDNNSTFGRIMRRCAFIIGCNVLFALSILPVITAGVGCAAMHYTLLRYLRSNGQCAFFRTWWQGVKENWKKATLTWFILLALGAVLGLELYWCLQFTGVMAWFRYGIIALLAAELIVGVYIFPVMVAFGAPLKQLAVYSAMFAAQRPLHLLVVLFANVVPMALTYAIPDQMPTWAFLWGMFGFGAVAMITDTLLLKQFLPHLPAVDAAGDIIPAELLDDPDVVRAGDDGQGGDSEAKTLAEMTKYGL